MSATLNAACTTLLPFRRCHRPVPPLVITAAELDDLFARLRRARQGESWAAKEQLALPKQRLSDKLHCYRSHRQSCGQFMAAALAGLPVSTSIFSATMEPVPHGVGIVTAYGTIMSEPLTRASTISR